MDVLQSPIRFQQNDCSKQRHRNMELDRLEGTGKDSAKAGQPQSKKLMGSRRKSISKGGKSSHAQTGSGQDPDDDTERRQQGDIVNSGSAAGTGWEISGEEDLISSAQCHKEKNI